MPAETVRTYKGEAKFLIAYYHFLLLKNYGPIPLIDRVLPIDMDKEDFPERESYDVCVDWIAALFDEAAEMLPADQTSTAYGRATSVAAMGIALKISMVINMVFAGFAFGAQPLIGYTYGAKDAKRFRAVIKLDLLVVCGFALVMTVVLWLLAPVVVRWFMTNPVVITHGTRMVRWLVSSATFAGLVLVFTTMFQSMGKALPAFLLSFSRQGLIFFLALTILAPTLGYTGILASQPLADLVTAGLAILLFLPYRLKG